MTEVNPFQQPMFLQAKSPASYVERRGTLVVEARSDWHFKESYTLLAPDGEANLITSSEPLDPPIDARHYASVQGDLLRSEFPGYCLVAEYEADVPGLPGTVYFREFSWAPPDGRPVTQMQLYAVAEDGRCGFTATATAASDAFDLYRDDLYQQMTSIVHHPTARPSSDVPTQLDPARATALQSP